MKKITSTFVVLLGLSLVFVSFTQIEIGKTEGTIYIRADGSVEETDKIQRDGNLYTLTSNIYEPLVVERDNIVIEGARYSIEGQHTGQAQSSDGIGLLVDRRNNVTINNVTIQHFLYGICFNSSSKTRLRCSL